MTATEVTFPVVERPLVSIVVVTYGGFDWVLGALQAVVDHTDPCYEVIVVDNASPDGTGPRLRDPVAGATIVLNDDNVGFGAGANQGALLAVGRHLFFLNSDAFVQPGWLPPLLALLDDDPTVGAAVSCLVEPDGTLQEAGGLVGANGYAGQLGMGADAASPEFRFRRQVDFGSGAALLVRRSEFLAVGGFHPGYVMGYFEDVDLCLELTRRGLRTVYEPASVVSHLRGASTDPDEALRRATASHAVFVRRWAQELDRRPPIAELDVHPHRLYAARDFVAADRILVVSAMPPDNALTALVEQLAELWPTARITVMTTGPAPPGLLDRGVEVAVDEDWDRWFTARRFHYSVVAVDGGEGLDRFEALLARTHPHAARIQLARFAGGPVDVEMAAVRAADAVVCMSERASELVGAWAGDCRGPVLGPSPPSAALVDLMTALGVAPPLARA
ncbi:MAG: glycosyltransferase family 2 protein [Acidimicrobiales bacterium]